MPLKKPVPFALKKKGPQKRSFKKEGFLLKRRIKEGKHFGKPRKPPKIKKFRKLKP